MICDGNTSGGVDNQNIYVEADGTIYYYNDTMEERIVNIPLGSVIHCCLIPQGGITQVRLNGTTVITNRGTDPVEYDYMVAGDITIVMYKGTWNGYTYIEIFDI